MAKASKTTVVEKKMVEVDVEKIVLELDREEAQALIDILARVGGSPRDSRRKYTQSVLESLEGTGLSYVNSDLVGDVRFKATNDYS